MLGHISCGTKKHVSEKDTLWSTLETLSLYTFRNLVWGSSKSQVHGGDVKRWYFRVPKLRNGRQMMQWYLHDCQGASSLCSQKSSSEHFWPSNLHHFEGCCKKLQHGPTHEFTGLVLYELAFQYGDRKSAIIRKAFLLQPSV